jgi:hypothetical protein
MLHEKKNMEIRGRYDAWNLSKNTGEEMHYCTPTLMWRSSFLYFRDQYEIIILVAAS